MVTTVVTAPTPTRPAPPSRPASLPADRRGAAVWALLVVAALVWGTARVADAGVALRAAPLYGRWSWHPGAGLVPALLVAAATVRWGPSVAARCRWRLLPVVAGAWAVVWAVALAASDGWSRLTAPLTTEHEYEPLATRIGGGPGDLGSFLGGYVEGLRELPIHVQGHPPGPVVLAWALDRAGLGGAGWLAAVALAGWGVAVAAALVAAGEDGARRAAPALAILPGAVWAATSLDALFAGLAAVAVAGAVLAAVRGSWPWAVAAGGVAGMTLLCTYGAPAVLLVGVAAVVALAARPARVLLVAAVAAAVPLALAAVAGFWWPAGLSATSTAYWDGVAAARPGPYLTFLGNPAALALAAGPAVAAGLRPTLRTATLRARAVVLPLAALVAVVLVDLSQMSRGEVERIWLPFVPLLALAAPGDRRGWLAAQAAVALALESTLVSAW